MTFKALVHGIAVILVSLLILIGLVYIVGDNEDKTEDKFDDYVALMEDIENPQNKDLAYLGLTKDQRCIMEFAWGLNLDNSMKALMRNPHRLLQDHYIDLAAAGLEVTLNYIKTVEIDGVNACFSVLDSKKKIQDMFNINEMCREELENGKFGDFKSVGINTFTDQQLVATFSILNSKYLSELPFSNSRLKEFLGSCAA
ncbi:hypothetical protein [Vibrio nigripulchritudo]|uniref:hypothetical protein n=1 Tax=Vibrio nigripulchritudo TaxID=28173 RepID=UPI0005F9E793|nr:hypothetical protein [Vibrio nigripulchritudo]KJY73606.1 hypothetical protein TW74_19845 [Vibrio nigripulchritudo]